MADFFEKAFAVAKKAIGPDIQDPGSSTVTSTELVEAGISIPKGDPRLKKGMMLNDFSPNDIKKIEAVRSKNAQ